MASCWLPGSTWLEDDSACALTHGENPSCLPYLRKLCDILSQQLPNVCQVPCIVYRSKMLLNAVADMILI